MPQQLQYPYRVPPRRTVPALLVTVGLTVFMAYFAYGNVRGLRFARVITLSPQGATWAYWTFAAVCLLGSVIMARIAIRSFRPAQMLVFGPHDVILPRATLRGEFCAVPYLTITSVQLRELRGKKFGVIQSSLGEFSVIPIGFESSHEFEEFLKAVNARACG